MAVGDPIRGGGANPLRWLKPADDSPAVGAEKVARSGQAGAAAPKTPSAFAAPKIFETLVDERLRARIAHLPAPKSLAEEVDKKLGFAKGLGDTVTGSDAEVVAQLLPASWSDHVLPGSHTLKQQPPSETGSRFADDARAVTVDKYDDGSREVSVSERDGSKRLELLIDPRGKITSITRRETADKSRPGFHYQVTTDGRNTQSLDSNLGDGRTYSLYTDKSMTQERLTNLRGTSLTLVSNRIVNEPPSEFLQQNTLKPQNAVSDAIQVARAFNRSFDLEIVEQSPFMVVVSPTDTEATLAPKMKAAGTAATAATLKR